MRAATAPGLLEREAHLAAIENALDAARAGSGGLVLLSGGPGTGKSALVERACRDAAAAEMTVLAAAGNELEQDFSFGVARQLLGHALEDPSPRPPRRGAAEQAARLLRGDAPADDGGADHSAAVINGLYWLMSDLADARPLLVAVDDAHWCDVPSLRFLLYLSRRLAELPVAVVVATRAPPARGAELVEQLDAATGARPLALGPLSASASAELVHARVEGAGDDFAAACFAATAGNPFLLAELTSEVTARGLDPTGETVGCLRERAPDAVVLAVARRVRVLDPESLAVLEAVAVLGDDAPLGFAAQLAGVDLDAAARAADALGELELLRPTVPLRFVHPLVAAAVRTSMPAVHRATLHRQAARLLHAHGAPVERLAAHLVESPSTGDGVVVERLRHASREALGHGAPESAARYLRRALEEPPPAEARTGVLRELAHAEALAGEPAATGRLAEALELTTDPRERAETLRALAGVLYRLGELAQAIETLERGLSTLGASDGELAIQMRAEIANIVSIRPDLPGASVAAPELPSAGRADLSLVERSWLTSAAVSKVLAAEPAAEALELAERAYGDGALLEQETADGTAIYALTGVLLVSGALARDVEVTSAAIADARRRGSVLGFATASFCRGSAQLLRGRLADAIADLETALDARRHGWRQYLPVASGLLAIARSETGDGPGARAALELAAGEDWPADIQRGMWLWARGYVALLDGDAERAHDDFVRWGEHMTGIANPAFHGAWRSHLALAAHRLGRGEEARALAREEVGAARRFGAPHPLGAALRALALVQDDEEEALALLEESVAVLENAEAELERLRSLVELGSARRRRRDAEAAREPLARALERAHALGCVRLADRAEEELRAAGMRPRRRAFTGLTSLTPGERRVTEMAASGMSNREIAEALFVTTKAVKWHLGNVYRKLGIASRTQLLDRLDEPR